MTFTTLEFAYFFAAVFLLYYILPGKCQWVILLLASGYFYFQVGIPGFLMLCAIAVITWGAGLIVEKAVNKAKKNADGKGSNVARNVAFWSSMLLFIILLVIMRLPFASFIMPLGLSFYTLQCIGYITEVYRESTAAEKNFFKLALYVSYFPHVLQGPFEDYKELKPQLDAVHVFDADKAYRGAARFLFGLMKKLVLADRIGYIVDSVFESPDGYYGLTVVIVMVLYTIQLYADFSGYMDMASGVSLLLGIEIRENFNVPYGSKSMAEFWRRWHMSLGLWFKAYIFYPCLRTKLCMNIQKHFKTKKKKYLMKTVPTAIALTVNWTLIGLWHGFDANYLAYDWFCGLIIIVSEFLRPVYAKVNDSAPKVFGSRVMDALRTVRTFLLVAFSFMFFRPETLGDSFLMMKDIFVRADVKAAAMFVYDHSYDMFLITLPLIILLVADILKYWEVDIFQKIHRWNPVCRWAVYILAILLVYICKGDRSAAGFAYYIF